MPIATINKLLFHYHLQNRIMGTKVWISVRSPNSRTVNIALLFFLAVYSKINIDISSKSIHFFRLVAYECFLYHVLFFKQKIYCYLRFCIRTRFCFWVENIGQNHVPYNKIIKLKNDGTKLAYKFIRNETLYIDTALFREKVCTLFRTFLYPYLHCSNHRKFV